MSARSICAVACCTCCSSDCPIRRRPSWPDKPIKFIVAAPAGSSLDVLARTIGDKLKDRLGQPVVVDNRPAAGGTVATDIDRQVASGRLHDGDLLQWSSGVRAPTCTRNCPTTRKGSERGDHHLQPAERAGDQCVLADQIGQGARRLCQGQPGKLNYASVGNGSSSHLTMELLKVTAGIDIVHVPFNGSPPAVTATIQGETQMMFAVMQPLRAQIQAGKLRALAVSTAKRFALLPDLPTVAEAGYPGFEALAWNGIWSPPERRARSCSVSIRKSTQY